MASVEGWREMQRMTLPIAKPACMPWRQRLWRSVALVFAAGVLAACATSPVPTYSGADIPGAFEQPIAADAPIWPDREWWRGFSSSELDTLVASAQSNNLALAAAEARVLQADARARQAGASLIPTVTLGFDVLRQRAGKSEASIGCISSSRNSFGACISAAYEIDFWGRNRSLRDASEASARASRADRETVALTIVSSTATVYFHLLSLRERLATSRLNLRNAQDILADTQARVEAGLAGPLEREQQQATVASQEAIVPLLARQELEARLALALLLGRAPEGFDVKAASLESISAPAVAPGLTSELLARRPDVVAAEASLEAAHANLAAARAALFPSISLTGSGGFESTALSSLLNPSTAVYSIAASLLQTVFDGGRLEAQSEEAAALQSEMLASYRQTILAAFGDVEMSLGAISFTLQQQRAQLQQVTHLQKALVIAQARYRGGLDSFLNVLDAQRSLYSARDQLADTKLAHLQAVVGLFRSLGGGWRPSELTPMAATDRPGSEVASDERK